MSNIIKNIIVLATLMLLFMASSCRMLKEYYVVIDVKLKAVDYCTMENGVLKYEVDGKLTTLHDAEALCIEEEI